MSNKPTKREIGLMAELKAARMTIEAMDNDLTAARKSRDYYMAKYREIQELTMTSTLPRLPKCDDDF